jgi:tRNA (guanine37-N1)-methyltransferase
VKRFTVVTLFPGLIDAYRGLGVIGRAVERGIIDIRTVNPRDCARDRRGTVDDAPYGGGPGMVMMVQPLREAIGRARRYSPCPAHVIYLSPQGRRFEQRAVSELGAHAHLVLIAGRYEGVDERVIQADVDSEWSVGDYVVSGGEVPAMLMIDAIARTLPGTLGDERSAQEDSFCGDLLDYPHFTRPDSIDDARVPAVLLGGDHAAIARWRRKQRLGRTLERRPDLLKRALLTEDDQHLIDEYLSEIGALKSDE